MSVTGRPREVQGMPVIQAPGREGNGFTWE